MYQLLQHEPLRGYNTTHTIPNGDHSPALSAINHTVTIEPKPNTYTLRSVWTMQRIGVQHHTVLCRLPVRVHCRAFGWGVSSDTLDLRVHLLLRYQYMCFAEPHRLLVRW